MKASRQDNATCIYRCFVLISVTSTVGKTLKLCLPHISLPYNKIGFISVSKSFVVSLMFVLKCTPVQSLFSLKTDLSAVFFPRYLYALKEVLLNIYA